MILIIAGGRFLFLNTKQLLVNLGHLCLEALLMVSQFFNFGLAAHKFCL